MIMPGPIFWKLTALIAVFAAAVPSQAATYAFDNRHAIVRFTYYAGLVPQYGRFSALQGQLRFDSEVSDQGSINAIIRTSSLSADDWESELRGSDFFNVSVFPEIRFKSVAVKAVDGKNAEFTGDLTMVGVTQRVQLRAKLTNGHHFSGHMRINRSAFKMTAFSLLVGDEIDIRIEADLIEDGKSG
jgi:polyisoprenoid-binding protein YceI